MQHEGRAGQMRLPTLHSVPAQATSAMHSAYDLHLSSLARDSVGLKMCRVGYVLRGTVTSKSGS